MTLMRAAHTLAYFAHAMEVRPNSHPEKTGRAITGTLSDGTVVDAAFVDGILGRKNSIDRLITKPTQRLADDRESLKDRLHSYIELRSVLKWHPPANMAYLTSLLDLNHSQHGQDGRSCLHQSLWPRLAFITQVWTQQFR